MGVNYFEDFFEAYIAQNRSIEQQVLNLTPLEKQGFYDYLLNNMKPENRYYLYDFFYDNCATRIKDVVAIVLKNNLEFNEPESFEAETFRTLIQTRLNKNSWGSLGIDMALGSVIDKKASPEEHMFLPKYISLFFENTIINKSEKLVKQSEVLFESIERPKTNSFLSSPLMICGIMSLFILIITFVDNKKKKAKQNGLTLALFTFTGIVGVFILLLWFATDHSATAYNYNLLWAFALNILMITQVFRKNPKIWFRKYLKFLVIMLVLLALHWILGIQVYAIGLIPILIALLIRYLYLIKYFKPLD